MAKERSQVVSIKVKLKRADKSEKDLAYTTPQELAETIGMLWGEAGKNMLVEYYTLKGDAAKAKSVQDTWAAGEVILFSKEPTCQWTGEP